jgi:hypothetical protein
MKKNILLVVFILLTTITNGKSFNNAQLNGVEKDRPIICKTGIYIKTLKINQPDEEFNILFYWWIRVDSIDINEDYKKITDIEFINSSSEIEITQEIIDKEKKYYYVTGICRATFPFKADFHEFPYDIQNLTISLENKNYNKTEILYVKDDKNAYMNIISDKNIEILNGDQYIIKGLNCSNSTFMYKTNFGDPSTVGNDEYSRINFNIEVSRNPLGIMMKLALPLFVVLILSYLVFFIPDHEIGTASALTVTSLLAAIAFQWTISDSLPKVSYFTTVDNVFYLVYSYIFYAMTQTVVTYNLSDGNEKAKNISSKIEIHSRWFFPLSFLLILLYILN